MSIWGGEEGGMRGDGGGMVSRCGRPTVCQALVTDSRPTPNVVHHTSLCPSPARSLRVMTRSHTLYSPPSARARASSYPSPTAQIIRCHDTLTRPPFRSPPRASSYAELSLLLVAALLTYTLTDSLELSGILSLFFAGITMRHYTYYNLSPAAQVGTASASPLAGRHATASPPPFLLPTHGCFSHTRTIPQWGGRTELKDRSSAGLGWLLVALPFKF